MRVRVRLRGRVRVCALAQTRSRTRTRTRMHALTRARTKPIKSVRALCVERLAVRDATTKLLFFPLARQPQEPHAGLPSSCPRLAWQGCDVQLGACQKEAPELLIEIAPNCPQLVPVGLVAANLDNFFGTLP